MSVKILLVEDHNVMRAGLRELILEQPDYEIVGETDNGIEAVALAKAFSPDVILMDITLRDAGMTGIEATREILETQKDIKIIGLSVWADASHVKAMISAGAMGYLSKTCSEEEMLEAIRAVLENNVYFSEEVKTTIQEEFVYDLQKPTKNNPNDLSNRELEVLRLTAHGKNTKTIADCLEISPKTVDAHKRKIMDKLDIHSIAGLTKYAIRKQIIHADE